MIPEAIKNAILDGTLLLRATRFYFWEIGVGTDEGETDAEFFIAGGRFRSHFEVHGINESYIKSNFDIEIKNRIIHEKEDRIEMVYDWLPSKNSQNEPTSLDFFIKDNQVKSLRFWFMAGTGEKMHFRTISFDVQHIEYCTNCYETFDIDYMSGEYECPYCGNVTRIKRQW